MRACGIAISRAIAATRICPLAIRQWFADAGFREHAFVSPGPDQFGVGWHQLCASVNAQTPPMTTVPAVIQSR